MLSLSACGFHLRKNTIHLGAKYPTIVFPFSGSHTLYQALQRALASSSIHTVDAMPLSDGTTVVPILRIAAEEITQQPLVYGPDSELRRERLRMTVSFSFENPPDVKNFTLTVERDHQLNSNQYLGDNAEKMIIEREMQTDIINQLLRYMETEDF